MDRYRVFISYSRQDKKLVESVDLVLRDLGQDPMWDRDLLPGRRFDEQIRNFIAHAHIFLPVFVSTPSNWVHQEIGYAMALNVPIVPLTAGAELDGMTGAIQQIKVDEKAPDMEKLKCDLAAVLSDGIREYADKSPALYECAQLHEDRSRYMASYAREVIALGRSGQVRQRGGFSSFSLPRLRATHEIWRQRRLPFVASQNLNDLQRRERIELEAHALKDGSRLVINPELYRECEPSARRVRLQTLLDFLTGEAGKKAEVAIDSTMDKYESVTIVGDWYLAFCIPSPITNRYEQTMFTRHAPTIRARISSFDEEFIELLQKRNWNPETSRAEAVKVIAETMASLTEAET